MTLTSAISGSISHSEGQIPPGFLLCQQTCDGHIPTEQRKIQKSPQVPLKLVAGVFVIFQGLYGSSDASRVCCNKELNKFLSLEFAQDSDFPLRYWITEDRADSVLIGTPGVVNFDNDDD